MKSFMLIGIRAVYDLIIMGRTELLTIVPNAQGQIILQGHILHYQTDSNLKDNNVLEELEIALCTAWNG